MTLPKGKAGVEMNEWMHCLPRMFVNSVYRIFTGGRMHLKTYGECWRRCQKVLAKEDFQLNLVPILWIAKMKQVNIFTIHISQQLFIKCRLQK